MSMPYDDDDIQYDVRKVLEAFQTGLFQRSARDESNPRWLLDCLSYLESLRRLASYTQFPTVEPIAGLGLLRIRSGFEGAGRLCIALGKEIFVGQEWTPVLFADDEDPTFFKSAGLEEV